MCHIVLLFRLGHHQSQYVSSHLFILRGRRSRMALFSVKGCCKENLISDHFYDTL